MSAEDIVTKDFEISITQQGGAKPGATKIGKDDLTITLTNSDVKINDVEIMMGPVMVGIVPVFSGALGCKGPMQSPGTANPPIAGAGIILSADSSDVKSTFLSVFLKGCTGTCMCVGTDTGPPPYNPPIPFVGTCKFEITDAGQTDVQGS